MCKSVRSLAISAAGSTIQSCAPFVAVNRLPKTQDLKPVFNLFRRFPAPLSPLYSHPCHRLASPSLVPPSSLYSGDRVRDGESRRSQFLTPSPSPTPSSSLYFCSLGFALPHPSTAWPSMMRCFCQLHYIRQHYATTVQQHFERCPPNPRRHGTVKFRSPPNKPEW